MDPRISIQLCHPSDQFQPGSPLACEYRVDWSKSEILAVEASVLWYTEGKGEEDLGVQYFERRVAGDAERGDLRGTYQFRTTLPNSPLSYEGVIVKVRWCARVRVFLPRGREVSAEVPFRLGQVPRAVLLDEVPAEGADDAVPEDESGIEGEPSSGGETEIESEAGTSDGNEQVSVKVEDAFPGSVAESGTAPRVRPGLAGGGLPASVPTLGPESADTGHSGRPGPAPPHAALEGDLSRHLARGELRREGPRAGRPGPGGGP